MYIVKNWQNFALAQDNSTTCWLTAYKMLYKWRGISAEGIDAILEKVGIKMFNDAGDGAKEKGLKAKDYVTANSSLGLNSLKGGELDDTELPYLLEKRGPIWATMLFGEKNHNIVIFGGGDGQVKYINPWWDVEKKYDVVTCALSQLNTVLKKFNNWKGANACFPGVIE
jgi:hypothetical protein